MKNSELVTFAMEIIKKYYEAEKQNILADGNCCRSDTLQALADECHALFNGFSDLLE